jgi:hypothetical protein
MQSILSFRDYAPFIIRNSIMRNIFTDRPDFLIIRLCRNPEFATNCKVLMYGADNACPPERLQCFAIVSYSPSLELSLQGDVTAAGADAFHAVAQKEL